MIKKLLERLKNFFNRQENKDILLLKESYIQKDLKKEFKDKLNVEEKQEILYLQYQYEVGKINKESLSTLEITNLIKLYKSQISELNTQIEIKKLKLSKV